MNLVDLSRRCALCSGDKFKRRADYWKSQGRKFCDFCKCWIADNKPSIDFHEGGKKHKENVSKRLKEIHKDSAKRAKQNKKFEDDLRKMENAAMAAYLKDVENNTKDMTAERIIKEKLEKFDKFGNTDLRKGAIEGTMGTPRANPAQYPIRNERTITEGIDPCDPMFRSKSIAGQSKSHRSGESKQTHAKSKSAKGKGKGKKRQEEEHPGKPVRKVWYEAYTPEGYAYYWHIETNESVWEPPEEGYMTLSEQEEEAKEHAIQEEFFKQLEQEEEKRKLEVLDEERANEERERLKAFRKREKEGRETSDGHEDLEASVAEEERPYRRDYSIPIEPQLPARKGWQIVRTTPRSTAVDLQLPVQRAQIQIPTFEKPAEPPITPRVFKEKTIDRITTEDDDVHLPSTFKKRKIGNKSVRKRTLDD